MSKNNFKMSKNIFFKIYKYFKKMSKNFIKNISKIFQKRVPKYFT